MCRYKTHKRYYKINKIFICIRKPECQARVYKRKREHVHGGEEEGAT